MKVPQGLRPGIAKGIDHFRTFSDAGLQRALGNMPSDDNDQAVTDLEENIPAIIFVMVERGISVEASDA